MSNLGNKCVCSQCGAKFYDLGKKNPTCPKCGAVYGADNEKVAAEISQIEEEKIVQEQEIDDVGDIDLSDFNDDKSDESLELKTTTAGSALSDIEAIDELEEPLESLSELEDMEIEEDIRNSDDADDAFLVDRVIEETEVTHLHRPHVVAGLVVAHAIPFLAHRALGDLIVPAPGVRFGFEEPIGHAFSRHSRRSGLA